MKGFILLSIALFMISAPNPDADTQRDMYAQLLTPVLSATDVVISPAHATVDASVTARPAAQEIPVSPVVAWIEPISVKGTISSGWVFLSKNDSEDTLLASADHGPIPHALRPGASALRAVVESR